MSTPLPIIAPRPPATIIIARPGFTDQRVFQVTPPSATWRTDGPGTFTCQIETRALAMDNLSLSGIAHAVKGRWLWWEHPTAGSWAGEITRTVVGPYWTTITAEQFNVLLRKRRTPIHAAPIVTSPGSLALRYLNDAERGGESYLLTDWVADESGPAVALEPRGGDLCDSVIPYLAGFGYQWRVRANTMRERVFEFRTRLGFDKSRTVLLATGLHIIDDGTMTGDLWTVANSIIGVSGDDHWKDTTGYQQDDDASMRALGRRYEETIAYTGLATRSTIAPLVKRDLAAKRFPTEVADLTICDANQCFAQFREGDRIGVISEHWQTRASLDVDIRTYDGATNTIRIAGALTPED